MQQRSSYEKGDLTSLAAVLAEVYATKEWSRQWRLFHLVRQWPEIVGAEIARLTKPAFFRRDILWMHVQDSAWMHHLQYVKPDLLERINRALADQPISDIRWQLQPADQPAPKPAHSERYVIDRDQEQAIHTLTESIPNPECREALRRLWRTLAARPG